MQNILKSRWAVAGTLVALLGGCVVAAPPPRAPHHPAYLHALSDLRAARWLIEHRSRQLGANGR